jgi:hypothetical protein
VQGGIRNEGRSRFVRRFEQRRRVGRDSRPVEWFVTSVERLRIEVRNSDPKAEVHETYHVIGDQLQMPAVDVNLIDVEDAADFAKNGGASSLDTVRTKNGVDVIRVD